MANTYIKSAPVARKLIGQKVYWDDPGPRYIFLRDGILEDVQGLHVCINGDWKERRYLKNLRTYPMGGDWARHHDVRDELDRG